MRRVYRREVAPLAYTNPSVNLIALGGLVLMVAGVCALARCGLSADADVPILGVVVQGMGQTAAVALAVVCNLTAPRSGTRSGGHCVTPALAIRCIYRTESCSRT